MIRILASASPGEVRVAVLNGDDLIDYAIWRPGAPDGFGDTHIGRITTHVPAMAGAFVALDRTDGFLPDSDGAANLPEGTYLTVRITRTAQGGKGPRLTAVGSLTVAGPPRLLERGPGALLRLASTYSDSTVTVDDPALIATLRPALGDRLERSIRAFDDTLESELEALGAQELQLPGGMTASIVPTPALTAIDVDGGTTTAGRTPKNAAQLAANKAAIPALTRQIRLRGLSGAILIDFAGLPIRQRKSLAPDLEAALKRDPARPRLIGFSHLGLAEILRPRGAAPLHERQAGPHAAGLAALRTVLRDTPTKSRVLRASPDITAALNADPVALPDLARRTTYPLILQTDPNLAPCTWIIEDAKP